MTTSPTCSSSPRNDAKPPRPPKKPPPNSMPIRPAPRKPASSPPNIPPNIPGRLKKPPVGAGTCGRRRGTGLRHGAIDWSRCFRRRRRGRGSRKCTAAAATEAAANPGIGLNRGQRQRRCNGAEREHRTKAEVAHSGPPKRAQTGLGPYIGMACPVLKTCASGRKVAAARRLRWRGLHQGYLPRASGRRASARAVAAR